MKKTILRLCAAAFSAAALCAGIAVPVSAKNVIDNGDFRYTVLEDGVSVQLTSYTGHSLYISIPRTVKEYNVVSVGAAAFRGNKDIKELDLTDSVKSIGSCAFEDCTSLRKVMLPGTLEEVSSGAFSDCTALSEITIDDGVRVIGDYAFSGCSSASEIKLPNSVDYIGDGAFLGCTALTKPGIPKTLEYFGAYALENTAWMKAQKGEFVTVGDGILIKYRGDSTTKSVPDSVKSIGSAAFAGNEKLKKIMLSSSVNSVGSAAFEDCISLEEVYLPDSVMSIGDRAFAGCRALSTLSLPKGISRINKECFTQSGLVNITLPASAVNIEDGAFRGCERLVEVTFTEGLKKVFGNAFAECSALRRAVFPSSLREIEGYAFSNCNSLTRVEFNSDAEIKSFAFSECQNLFEAVFYKNPSKLEPSAFNLCTKLTIYSDNNLYLQEYAAANGAKSEDIRNLKNFELNAPIENQEETQTAFSGGYTFAVILIILVDTGLIILFSGYILFIEPKQRAAAAKRMKEKSRKKKAPVRPDDGDVVNVEFVGPQVSAAKDKPVKKRPVDDAQNKPVKKRPAAKVGHPEATETGKPVHSPVARNKNHRRAPSAVKAPKDDKSATKEFIKRSDKEQK